MRKSCVHLVPQNKEESSTKMTLKMQIDFLNRIVRRCDETIASGKHYPGNPSIQPMVQMAEGRKDLAEAMLLALKGDTVHLRILAGV